MSDIHTFETMFRYFSYQSCLLCTLAAVFLIFNMSMLEIVLSFTYSVGPFCSGPKVKSSKFSSYEYAVSELKVHSRNSHDMSKQLYGIWIGKRQKYAFLDNFNRLKLLVVEHVGSIHASNHEELM